MRKGPSSERFGVDSIRSFSSNPSQPQSQIIRFPKKNKPVGPDVPDPVGYLPGTIRPRMADAAGRIWKEFKETDGDYRVIARRLSVTAREVTRTVAREIYIREQKKAA